MTNITKSTTRMDSEQVIQRVFNAVDASLATSGFLTTKLGNKVLRAVSTTTIPNDTEQYSFYDGATLLYTIQIVYTDATLDSMISAERIA